VTNYVETRIKFEFMNEDDTFIESKAEKMF
jgi:hypothetical protein